MATIPAAMTVGVNCSVNAKKEGTATITATAMDGSGKKAKVKLKVVKFTSDKTPAPTAPPDTRKRTKVEDFENYAVGTAWSKFTAGGFANPGSMTVVQDPENAENKCLEIKFDGADQAYDYAPVFNIDLAKLENAADKTLSSFSGVDLDSRVVSNDPSAVQYKNIAGYFDEYNKIQASDYFATSNNTENTAHVANPAYRFGVNISMIQGSDKENAVTLHNGNTSKESNKYFPFAYSAWKAEDAATHFAADSCTLGFKSSEGQAKVGFATRSLSFDTTRINEANDKLMSAKQFDFVVGSTYQGGSAYKTNNTSVTLYLDNISLVEEDIALESIEVSAEPKEIAVGANSKLTVKYTPDNTTHRAVIFTSNNTDVATVDSEGNVTGKAVGTAVITATPKDNPALAKSVEIQVVSIEAAEDIDLLKTAVVVETSTAEGVKLKSETDAVKQDDGSIRINYTKNNESILLDLGQEYDLRGHKGIEITGTVPGQMSMEFYSADLDMTADEWWKKKAGGTYPFFTGSCSWRFEDGAFNEAKSKAEGLVTADDELLPSIETLRYSLKKLTGTDDTGDYSRIRYVVLKSNALPMRPAEWNLNNYVIHGMKAVAGKDFNADIIDYTKNCVDQVNQAAVESGDVTYSDNGVKASQEETVVSYYLDILTQASIDADTKTAAKHDTEFSLEEFGYIKVVVGADTTQLDVKLRKKDATYEEGTLVGTDSGSGERTIYFPLSALGDDVDLTSFDTISLCPHGGSIKSVTAINGEPLLESAKFPNQYVVNEDGTRRLLVSGVDSNS